MDIKNDLIIKGESLFDSIRHVNEYGQEYWSARASIGIRTMATLQ